MTTKNAILISALSVALILIISFGVTNVIANNNGASQTDLILASKIAERETAYRLLVAEANQRIATLNAQVQQGNTPVNQNPAMLTADSVLSIAYQTVGSDQALSGVPQLVDFQGTTAYEIPFINGMLYIDARSGAVLSSNVQTQITDQQAIEIAANYLGVLNPSSAVVTPYTVDGTEVYKVTIANYVLFVDKFGTITKIQVIQYNSPSSGGSSSSSAPKGGESESEGD
jgi:hypothetical protein